MWGSKPWLQPDIAPASIRERGDARRQLTGPFLKITRDIHQLPQGGESLVLVSLHQISLGAKGESPAATRSNSRAPSTALSLRRSQAPRKKRGAAAAGSRSSAARRPAMVSG